MKVKENDRQLRQVCTEPIVISKLMYLYLHYFLFIWITDAVNLGCLLLNISQTFYASHIVSLLLLLLICRADRKYFELRKQYFTFVDIIVMLFILILGIYKCIYPDTCYDVMAYHVINQRPEWTLKGSFYVYGMSFPFADRLFYLFRYVLGYRAGTLANALVLLVTYFQVKRVTESILQDRSDFLQTKKGRNLLSIGAFLVIMLESVLMELGTYMTDMVAVPLMLEAFCILCESLRKEKRKVHGMVFFAALLSFIFLCKLTSAIIVVVLLAGYLFINRKGITLKGFILCLCAAVVLIVPFILYNLYYIGVPLYELFFVFGRFAGQGQVDVRWGAQNIWQMIFWPVYMAFYPTYRHMELIDIPNLFPLAAIIVFTVASLKKRGSYCNREMKGVFVLTLAGYYLWVVSRGVDRYALVNLIMFGIILLAIFLVACEKTRITRIVLGGILAVQCLSGIYGVMWLNNSWQNAPSVMEQLSNGEKGYASHLQYIGKDRGEVVADGDKYQYMVFTEKDAIAYGYLLNHEVEIYQLNLLGRVPEKEQQKAQEAIDRLFETQEVYSAYYAKGFDSYMRSLSNYGLYVAEMEYIGDNYLNDIIVYKVEKDPERVNEVHQLGIENDVEIGICEGNTTYNLTASALISPYVTWTDLPVTLEIYYKEGEERVNILTEQLYPGHISQLNTLFTVPQTEEMREVKIYANVSFNYSLNWNVTSIVNVELNESEQAAH